MDILVASPYLSEFAVYGVFRQQRSIYNPKQGRWFTRDPLGEAGGINLYAFVGNNPVNWVDPWGEDIVKNETGIPIMISENPGPDNGSGPQYYVIIPPDGNLYGGNETPVTAYPGPSDALIAAGFAEGPIRQPQSVCDIDFYDNPSKPLIPAEPDSTLNTKLPGDAKGPVTTFTINKKGEVIAKKGKISVVGSYWRALWR
jgi:hypothetical protein